MKQRAGLGASALRASLLAALSLPGLAAADPGYVSEATPLRDKPAADGAVMQQLPEASSVNVVARQGGWYQVQAGGQQGWVRMAALRLHAPGAAPGLLDGGRLAATQSVSSTAVRGFSAANLEAANPNPAAVDALESSAIAPDDARSFAAAANLQASTADSK